MDRKKFLQRSLYGMGGAIVAPSLLIRCDDEATDNPPSGECTVMPTETAGPFVIKYPADLVRQNIIGDRAGIPLLIQLTIQSQSNQCAPLPNVLVDVWHCDADGDYSEYGGNAMQPTDYTGVHFLRGRQSTDSLGQVSFLSLFPGWYPGRAPHIHIEVLTDQGQSLLVSQIAFPKSACDEVYATALYPRGEADTQNAQDGSFYNSESENMADSLTGNVNDGYTLQKVIVV